jgi:hypothetical protein
MDLQFNPEISMANILTVSVTFAIALMAWSSVSGQVESNKSSIEEAKVVSQEMNDTIHALSIDVALLKQDAENAAQSREEIKANQAEILKILRKI